MIAITVAASALLLIALRVPVGWSLILPSLAYLHFRTTLSPSAAVEWMVVSVNGFALLAVPLFILVGTISNETGLGERIFSGVQPLVGRVRGGIGYVSVFASLGFSWMSGSAVSDVAVSGSVQIPELRKRGYSGALSAGIVTSSSLITPLMPPSIPAIIFGVTSGVSIGAMFIASVVPTLILVLALLASLWWATRKRDDLRPTEVGSRRQAVRQLLPIAPAPVLVLGGILGGYFTPTEAAAAALVYLCLITFVVYRTLTWTAIRRALRDAARSTGTIMFIVMGSALFSTVLTLERVPQRMAELLSSLTQEPAVFLLILFALMLVLGMVIDPVAGILISTPVFLPAAVSIGADPVHFGVVLIFSLLIGLFTPPVGLLIFVLESVTDLDSREIVSGVLPFLWVFLAVGVLLIMVPGLSLWLPGATG